MVIIWKEIHYRFVSPVDVFLIAGERDPAKGPFSDTEQRTNIRRHEAGIIECISDAVVFRSLSEVVAVIEYHRPALLKFEHCLDMPCHRGHRPPFIFDLVRYPQS